MDAGIHAREWIAPAVATYIADYITRNFNTLPDSITNKDWLALYKRTLFNYIVKLQKTLFIPRDVIISVQHNVKNLTRLIL